MKQASNAMCRQVWSLPELLRQQYEYLEPECRKVLTTPEIFSIQRIVLTGCGDSHAAAMATRYAFENLTGIPTEVVPAIELSRYYDARQLGFAPHNPLIIAVSNSGGIARVGEAIQRAVAHGAFALGVTGNPESLLGRSASRILPLSIPPFESAPGTRSYLVSLLALLLLAIRFGEVRGRYTMDQAMDYRNDLLAQAQALEETLPAMDAQMKELAGAWKDMDAFDFIGAGPDYASAWFGQAKIYEACGKYAMCVNTEEWLHLNFFMKNVSKIGTILVCEGGSPALSRAQEVAHYANDDMGRPLLVVSSGANQFAGLESRVVTTPASRYAQSGALTQFAPLCLLAGYLGEFLGEEDGRGCKGPWQFAAGGRGITQSKMIVK